MSAVYLIHFSQPYHHAQHYLGWSGYDVHARLAHHRQGQGARLLEVVAAHAIAFDVVRVWPGQSRWFERRLKNQNNTKRLCPVCNPHGWANRERTPYA